MIPILLATCPALRVVVSTLQILTTSHVGMNLRLFLLLGTFDNCICGFPGQNTTTKMSQFKLNPGGRVLTGSSAGCARDLATAQLSQFLGSTYGHSEGYSRHRF